MRNRPRIINHMGPEIGAALRAHSARPEVTDLASGDSPWDIVDGTDILVTHATPAWKNTPGDWVPPASLNWVQTFSVGIEIYPPQLLRGRIVTNGRGQASEPIADYVLAAILRRLRPLEDLAATSAADWQDPSLRALGEETIGLFGYGAIGQAVARRVRAFGMRVVAMRRTPWPDAPEDIRVVSTAEELFAGTDHLVLAAPLTAATRHVVNARLLTHARPGLHLVNISRGGLVDQAALVSALDAGHLSFATLDVTDPEPLPDTHPLYRHPKVLVTPHLSWVGGDAQTIFRDKLLRNLTLWQDGDKDMVDQVDLAQEY